MYRGIDQTRIMTLHSALWSNTCSTIFYLRMSDSIHTLLEQAISHHQQARLQSAEDCYAKVLQIDPRQFDALHLIGVIAKQRGDHQTAMNFFAKAIAVDPKQAKVHCNLGATLQDLDKSTEALACYDLAISLQKDYAMAWNNRGNCLRQLGRYAEALESFTRAMEVQINYPEAFLNRGVCLQEIDEHEQALIDFEDALRLRAIYPAAQFARGYSLQQLHRYSQALEAYALANDPHSSAQQQAAVQCNRGMVLNKLLRFEDALEALQLATDIQPHFGNAHLQSGHAYRALHNKEAAVIAYQTAALYMKDERHQQQLAYLLASLGHGAIPAHAPTPYVKELFDQYADHFETHLQDQLAYQVPQLLQAALQDILSNSGKTQRLVSLDLGCGTGLSAEYLQSISSTLIGVDLSEKMLAKARTRDCYSQLVCDDIVHFLDSSQIKFDLMLAADVLVYFGELETLFGRIAQGLKTQGLFAFSVELSNAAEIHLSSSQRYKHSRVYVEKLAAQFHFQLAHCSQHVGRHEARAEVDSLIVVCRKP